MAIRADLTVDYTLSPRITTVAAPSTTVTVQDLYDTLADIQTKPWTMMEKILVKAGGKDDLGGGKKVGVTVVLQNARLGFAARPGPSYVQCKVTDGNLVAVDETNATINEIEPTAFTQVVVEKSTSPTLVVSGSGVTAQDKLDIADRVLDELVTDHGATGSLGAAVSAVKSRVDSMMTTPGIKRMTAINNFSFIMVDSTDHITPKSGLTVAGQISKDGSAFQPLAMSVSENGNGVYNVQLTSTEMDGEFVTLRFTATGADVNIISIMTGV